MHQFIRSFVQEYLHWKENVTHGEDTLLSMNGAIGRGGGGNGDEWEDDIHFFITGTHATTKAHIDQHLSYGVLVKEFADYHYLNSAVRDNRFSLEVTVGSDMNQLFPRGEETTDVMQEYFFKALRVEGLVLAAIACFGVVYEMLYRRKSYSSQEDSPDSSKENFVDGLECAVGGEGII